ncbi:MAG: hypothetical protein R2832_17305 [Rhodothermales bacterium]
MKEWIGRWPNAKKYFVYLDGLEFSGISTNSPEYHLRVNQWLLFWERTIREMGVAPEKFSILLIDEPNNELEWRETLDFAQSVRDSGTDFRVFTNPTESLWKTTSALPTGYVGEIAINLRDVLETGILSWPTSLEDFQGERWVYSTFSDVRNSDPYYYNLIQAWRTFVLHGSGSGFWSFVDSGGALAWDDLESNGTNSSPLYFDGATVFPSKHLVAIQEGQNDFAYLKALENVSRSRSSDGDLARSLLAEIRTWIEGLDDTGRVWNVDRERSQADEFRRRMFDLLNRDAR